MLCVSNGYRGGIESAAKKVGLEVLKPMKVKAIRASVSRNDVFAYRMREISMCC